ncbi:MarR family transcriptional regulator [Streptomyces sp. NPDC001941]|uniref:MarR family winged helix-turn-helix transcriptional regulator n=1 Tax=Streptomyces sp. NPDC001941 TaxID=3154659 RepID=UPI00332EE3A1
MTVQRAEATASPDPLCSGLPETARGGPVSYSLSVAARLHRIAAGRLLRELGVYPGQELLMMRLWGAGPVRQSELIKAMDLDPSTVTKMVQRLEQAGHLRRTPDPADRRAVLVEATEDSCDLHRQVEAAWAELEDRTLAGFTARERAEFGRLLDKAAGNLCREAAEDAGCR